MCGACDQKALVQAFAQTSICAQLPCPGRSVTSHSGSDVLRACQVADAHGDDIHCVDWNGAEEHLVLTGGADHSVRLFDRRKLAASGTAAVVHTFAAHSAEILSVQWNPHRANVFASGGEDGLVMVWDAAAAGAHQNGAGSVKQPPGLMFQHAGHR